MLLNYFFDFDKTLASSGDASVKATKQAFQDNGLTVPPTDAILDAMGIPAEVSFPQMANEKLTAQQATRLVTRFREVYSDYELASTKLYPGIQEMLDQLTQQHQNLFIVSSKRTDAVERNLKNLKIIDYFKDVVGCDQVEHYKPAPDGILLLLDRYQLQKDDSLMIGDARYDLQMGKAAGVHTCGVTWDAFDVASLKREQPTYLIATPAELVSLGQN
ncbi:HAD family hydrolase [uncultured Limosilactobacillus sp.]|uniref:HAD family hydrolase n=1 Tax=uncultured Limosilactobacillus sp. TaxID=2837629 RepID=UPI0025FEB0F5|nr:HAD family hydrolase [uncultured Limosilactobacillus sp.]